MTKIEKVTSNSCFAHLDNNLSVYIDNANGYIKIIDNKGNDLNYEYPKVNEDGDCSVIKIWKGETKWVDLITK